MQHVFSPTNLYLQLSLQYFLNDWLDPPWDLPTTTTVCPESLWFDHTRVEGRDKSEIHKHFSAVKQFSLLTFSDAYLTREFLTCSRDAISQVPDKTRAMIGRVSLGDTHPPRTGREKNVVLVQTRRCGIKGQAPPPVHASETQIFEKKNMANDDG